MSEHNALLSELASSQTKFVRTLQIVEELEKNHRPEKQISLGISANVSVDMLSLKLRRHGLLHGIGVDAHPGNHDDALTDAATFSSQQMDGMIVLNLFDNISPSLEARLAQFSPDQIAQHLDDFRTRIRLTFETAKSLPRVFVLDFHRMSEPSDLIEPDMVDETIEAFNVCLRKEAARFANVHLLRSDPIIRSIGARNCFDKRFYFQNTAPYTADFLDELARRIFLASRGFNSYFHKALVLDCDNTLWGGVIGEDFVEGIKLDPHSYPGKIFWRVQNEIADLEQKGVLLCLCSKNNPEDVEHVLEKHEHMVLTERKIAVKAVNWSDKVSSLRAIATSLNIGLDSLVFVDDSAFECEAVRCALPMVKVFQVPKRLSDYPGMISDIKELFLAGGVAAESRSKTEQYRIRQHAEEASRDFASHEEYLASLGLRVRLKADERANAARISELSLKSNQFNLTTERLTVADILDRLTSPDFTVYSLSVEDRFGSAGLTGVVIANWRGDTAIIETFLMSCRVIGRGIEFSIWPAIVRDAVARGCSALRTTYKATLKNAQVSGFYDKLGMPLVSQNDGIREYAVSLAEFVPNTVNWIEVIEDND